MFFRCAPLYVLLAVFLLNTGSAYAADAVKLDRVLTAEQVREDISEWLDWTEKTHPDLSYSTDIERVRVEASRLDRSLPETLTVAQAWRAMATLNPHFNDAHVGLLVPVDAEDRSPSRELIINARPEGLFITDDGDTGTVETQVEAFNGRPWSELERVALERLRGENDALRRFIIERRLYPLLRVLLSENDVQTMTERSASGELVELPIDPSQIRFQAPDGAGYRLDFEGSTAVLRVPSFARSRAAEFEAFLPEAFAAIAERGSTRLIIDLSQNGGGAHDLSDQLMAYLTDKLYTATSAITARITPENQPLVPGSQLGEVVTVPFAEPVTPPPQLEHRFTGDVEILLGAKTYSQAIVFAATAQDHGLARLVGESPQAPANQTGQVQTHTLTNTGFSVRAPIYIIYRHSGDRSRAPLVVEASGRSG